MNRRIVSDPQKLNFWISKLRASFMESAEKLVVKTKKKSHGDARQPEEEHRKRDGSSTVVMKADLHCECDDCASNLLKFIRSFDDVDSATIEFGQRIKVVGRVEPAELRRRIEEKTHIRIELVSPHPGPGYFKNDSKQSKSKTELVKTSFGSINGKKSYQEEIPVTTAVMKMNLHCEGCIQKIRRRITRTKGYKDMKIDRQKELVTVIGAMDMTELAEALKKYMKKGVDILPPPKFQEKQKPTTSEKPKKDKGRMAAEDGGIKALPGGIVVGRAPTNQLPPLQPVFPDPNLLFRNPNQYPFPNGQSFPMDQFYHYRPYPLQAPAPQLFSDENPNACTVM